MNDSSVITRVISMVKDTVSVGVHEGIVPETETGTAIAISNTGFDLGTRRLSGKSSGASSLWRATISGPSKADNNVVEKLLLALDNTTSDDFQRIYVQIENIEAKEPNQTIFRLFLSIEVYNR